MIDYLQELKELLGLNSEQSQEQQYQPSYTEQLTQQSQQPEQTVTNSLLNYLGYLTPNQQNQGIPYAQNGSQNGSGFDLSSLLARSISQTPIAPQSANLGLQRSLVDYSSGSGNQKPQSAITDRKDVQNMIVQSAQKYGIDPSIALAVGHIESRFNPNAKASGSSAKGVYQFVDGTAKQYGIYGKQFDAAANIDAGMRLFRDNRAAFIKQFGREPTAGEIYLYHQQGSGSGAALLRNPNKLAVDVIGRDTVIKNGGKPNMTAAQFANMWISKGNSLQQTYRKQLG